MSVRGPEVVENNGVELAKKNKYLENLSQNFYKKSFLETTLFLSQEV